MRSLIVFITTLILITPVLGLSLEQAVELARTQNPEILAAKNNWLASRDKIASISTWPDPQIELMYEQIPQTGGGLNDASMKMYGLSQMIPFPGKLTLKRRQGEAMASAVEQKFLTKTNQVIARVKKSYYSLFLIDQAIAINKENKRLLQKFAKIAEANYVVAKASQHDVIKAQIELELLSDQLITLEQKRQTAVARLNTLLNRGPDTKITLPENLEVIAPKISLSDLESRALAARPELKTTEYLTKQSGEMLALAKMDYLPDFKVKVLQREMPTGLNGWNATFMADLPLWFWSKTSAVSAAGKKHEAAQALQVQQVNQVRFEVQDIFVRVDSAKRLVKLYQTKIIPKAEQALRSALIAYQADKVDFLALINSQKTLENSRLKYFQSLAELGQGLAELERIIGGNINEQKS